MAEPLVYRAGHLALSPQNEHLTPGGCSINVYGVGGEE